MKLFRGLFDLICILGLFNLGFDAYNLYKHVDQKVNQVNEKVEHVLETVEKVNGIINYDDNE